MMEKKRSKGVTILACLFIIGGSLSLFGSLNMLTARQNYQQMTPKMFKEKVLKSNIATKMSEEEIEEFNRVIQSPEFNKMIAAQSKFMNSGSFTSMLPLNLLFGLMSFILGVGLLKLQEWSRKLAIIYQIASIPIFLIFQYRMFNNLADIFSKGAPGLPQALPFMVVIQGIMMAAVAAVIVFFLTRPKVKEQFID